ncbi:MAG: MBL fold metallo-hydrolase [Ilumatobacter sp.]|nr:MBL fold metallo-hydrolase [Ilumatobacter sp.]
MVPGHEPILFDLGTGARYFGLQCGDEPFNGSCLVSHLHWDHVQGLPFFPPLLRPGNHVTIYAPIQEDGTPIEKVMRASLGPPMFPVELDDFPGRVTFHDKGDDTFMLGDVQVTSRLIPHLGNTLGFRLDVDGVSVAYLSDHQQPGIDVYEATDNARELCDGVDLLIHDAQFDRAEFARKANWGHCTTEYAVWLATTSGAKRLALFHHDPSHGDDRIDEQLAAARAQAGSRVDVVAASEGLTIHLGP